MHTAGLALCLVHSGDTSSPSRTLRCSCFLSSSRYRRNDSSAVIGATLLLFPLISFPCDQSPFRFQHGGMQRMEGQKGHLFPRAPCNPARKKKKEIESLGFSFSEWS